MAYDEVLAERVADLCALPVKRMFGGITFLVSGNIACGVIADDLLVRVPLDEYDVALTEPGVRVFDLTGRVMTGWVVVAGETLDDDVLGDWVGRGVAYAGSLPPK